MRHINLRIFCLSIFLLSACLTLQAQLVWQCGKDDGGWPTGDGGGVNASFEQENGVINPLPGSPVSTENPQGADNDYYFAGSYTTTIASIFSLYGPYTPVGTVSVDEEAAERAFAAADNDLRYHFNLPTSLRPFDLLTVTFDALNLHDGQPDTRYGIEVYINGILVQTQIVIRAAQLNTPFTTPPFRLDQVNAQTGPGFDNIVSLKGINYNNDGGGNWMGIDYVQLNSAAGVPPIVRRTVFTPENTAWAYNDSTVAPGLSGPWTTPGYDTNSEPGWKTGQALFGNDGAGIYDGPGQPFAGLGLNGFLTPWDRSGGRITFYARTKFNWTGPTAGVTLIASNWVDDGLIAYLNGVEVSRIRVPDAPAPVTWDTLGSNPPTEGMVEVRTWDSSALVQGENTIAVEVHQSSAGSSDVAFALGLDAVNPLAPLLTNPSQPTNRVVFANRSTTLLVEAIGSPDPGYQWVKDGSPITGATASTYTIAQMQASDAGNYFCRVFNAVGSVTSRTAIVEYLLDTSPPEITDAVGSATFDKVTVSFNELVDAATAGDLFNYTVMDSVGNDLAVGLAVVLPGGKSVLLTLSIPQTPDTLYTVTAINMRDLAGNAAGSLSKSFRSWVSGPCNGVIFETFDTPGRSTIDNLLTSQPNFPNNPRERMLISGFDSRLAPGYDGDAHEDYSARLRGLFIPPVSGNWRFHFRCDDPGRLFVNPNGPNAAGKIMVGDQPSCCNNIPASGAQLSSYYALEAGRPYYVELLYWEYGGGDYGQVSVELQGGELPAANVGNLIGSLVGAGAAPAGIGGPLSIATEPADLTVVANSIAQFTVVANNPNALPICYQWRRDGVDIPGATSASYTIQQASAADDGATFSCVVGMIGQNNLTTRTATLRVANDVIAPRALRADVGNTLSNIVVSYNELVDTSSATDLFNYDVPGFVIDNIVLQPGGSNVVITLAGTLQSGRNYSVVAHDVSDLSGNALEPNPTVLNFSIPTAGGYSATVLAENPIAYWRFNEGGPTANNAGSLGPSANGTYNGGATSGAEAPKPPAFPGFEAGNSALQLDGVDDFVGTVAGLMNSRPAWTITGWFRRGADQADRTGLWGQNDLLEIGYINNNTIQTWTENGTDIVGPGIANGEWAHLAVVSEGSPGTLNMYLNGVLRATRNHSMPADTTFAFNIGGGGVFDATGNFFNGQIDEIAIFGQALTAAKVQAQYQSALRSPGFNFDDCVLPPGTIASGTTPPFVASDGAGNCVLHLTDKANDQVNFWSVPLSNAQAFVTFNARWRMLLDGPGGADGVSFNVGTDLGTGFTPEDGAPSGLSVCVDTYNNGAGDAGLDIKWNGVVLRHVPVPAAGGADGAGAPPELNRGVFVNTSVEVTSSGAVTFRYAELVATAQIPNYVGISANQYLFAARTGGANENAWIDDLIIETTSPVGPAIVTQPADQTVPVGQAATFTAEATGTGTITYQWSRQRSGEAAFTPLAGATGPSYTTPPAAYPSDDNSLFRVAASNADGTTQSRVATLRVIPKGLPFQVWMVGKDDGDWPRGDGGGPNASFVQENGTTSPLPGSPTSPEVDQQADNDYYFAGTYSTAISSVTALYGDYAPVGVVAANEEAAERAFAGDDRDLRYHFNLPTSLKPSDQLSVQFDALNLDTTSCCGLPVPTDPRWGMEVYINGVLVMPQVIIRPPQIGTAFSSPPVSLASVNAQTGPGADNIVTLKGISYNADGGGNWMGIDYVQLNGIAVDLLANVVETGGDNEPTDTITAKWTGQTFPVSVAGEPVPGAVVGNNYTVGPFGNHAPAYVDRNHRYTNASDTVQIPAYLVGGKYVMSGNDNRDNAGYLLDVTVSAPVTAYLLVDNRLGDPNSPNTDPPSFGPTRMQWVLDQGWIPSSTGANRTGDVSLPDEVGIDEGADGTINNWFSVYRKNFSAGTFQLKQADNAGQNMYGVVVTEQTAEPPRVVSCTANCEPNKIRVKYSSLVRLDGTYSFAEGTVAGVSYGADQSEVVVETTPLPNNTTVQLTIAGVQGQAGGFIFPNPSVCSVNVTLGTPTVGSGPSDVSVPVNASVTFAVSGVGGTTPISYQWLRNGAALPGATGASLSFAAALADNGAKYSVRLSNQCGAATSREATLTVAGPPTIVCPADISVVASNNVCAVVTFNPTVGNGGFVTSVSCLPPSGTCFPVGAASVTCAATDSAGNTARCSFNVTVRPSNRPPTAKITAEPLADFKPTVTEPVLIACDNTNSCLHLDGSLSSDPEGGALTYAWFLDPSPVPSATGVTATVCPEPGEQTIRLVVTDPFGETGTDTLTIQVMLVDESIALLIDKVNNSTIARKEKRPFIATLKAASASAARTDYSATIGQLNAFQNKVRAQVARTNPEEAASWIKWAQQIIDATSRCL
jgi:hypothetical protein